MVVFAERENYAHGLRLGTFLDLSATFAGGQELGWQSKPFCMSLASTLLHNSFSRLLFSVLVDLSQAYMVPQ